MAAIFQTTFSNAFSWMKMYSIRLRFHWSLFPRVKLTIFQHWFRYWLGADQATSHYLNQGWKVYWRIYASLGLNELRYDFDLRFPEPNVEKKKHLLGILWPIDMERKVSESIGIRPCLWLRYHSLPWPGTLKIKFERSDWQEREGRLTWNERNKTPGDVWPTLWPLAMTLNLNLRDRLFTRFRVVLVEIVVSVHDGAWEQEVQTRGHWRSGFWRSVRTSPSGMAKRHWMKGRWVDMKSDRLFDFDLTHDLDLDFGKTFISGMRV